MQKFAIFHCFVVNEMLTAIQCHLIPSLTQRATKIICLYYAVHAIVSHWTYSTQLKLVCAAM